MSERDRAMGNRPLVFAVLVLCAVSLGTCVSPFQQSLRVDTKAKEDGPALRRSCPICDTSVFPYCGDKLLHDACCCLDPIDTPLPYQCNYADCSFLHANSCQEHKLITKCCCNRAYFYLARNCNSPVWVFGRHDALVIATGIAEMAIFCQKSREL